MYLITTPVFNVISYGINKEEAMENFNYAMDDFWKGMLSNGRIQLTKWLNKLGWKLNENIIKNKEFDKFKIDKSKNFYSKIDNFQISNINNNLLVKEY